MAMRIFADMLNKCKGVNTDVNIYFDSLIRADSRFAWGSLSSCDLVCVGYPNVAPYELDVALCDAILNSNKPVIMFMSADCDDFVVRAGQDYLQFLVALYDKNQLRLVFAKDCLDWRKYSMFPKLRIQPIMGIPDWATEKFRAHYPLRSFTDYESSIFKAALWGSCHKNRKNVWDTLGSFGHQVFLVDANTGVRLDHVSFLNAHQQSLMGLALAGSSSRGVRVIEVMFNTLLSVPDYFLQLTWEYPFWDGYSCFTLPYVRTTEDVMGGCLGMLFSFDAVSFCNKFEAYLSRPKVLYEMYKECYNNATNYLFENYLPNYVGNTLLEVL